MSDNGIGIASASLGQVFDVFTQVDAASAHASGGLGLGLTVVRRILELHGGQVDVRSAGLGQGSEFIARLPLISIQRAPASEAVRAPPPPLVSGGTSRRVLIVDDNLDSAALMAMVFEHRGHEVRTAETGLGALELLESFAPDVAYVDIGPAADRQRALEAGFDEHVVKPVDADRLAGVLGGA